jgi:hypothetical protein
LSLSLYLTMRLPPISSDRSQRGNRTPNHALQRTAPRVTVAAISSSNPSRPSVTFP